MGYSDQQIRDNLKNVSGTRQKGIDFSEMNFGLIEGEIVTVDANNDSCKFKIFQYDKEFTGYLIFPIDLQNFVLKNGNYYPNFKCGVYALQSNDVENYFIIPKNLYQTGNISEEGLNNIIEKINKNINTKINELNEQINGIKPVIPVIGENDNWWINDEDTGKKAIGKDGDTGILDIIDGYWAINNIKTDTKAQGEPGISPKLTIENGYFYINGNNTNQKAQGEPGLAGTQIGISNDGYWVINGIRTDYKIEGEDGSTPKIEIVNGYWYINDENTNQKAQGDKGDTGVGITDIELYNTNNQTKTYKIIFDDGTERFFDVNDGIDGLTPTIEIKNDKWFINNVDTGINAKGQKGDTGIWFGESEPPNNDYKIWINLNEDNDCSNGNNNIDIQALKNEIKQEIKEEEHKVGTFFWSKFNEDPSIQLNMPGTTWQRIESRYLKAINDSETPGPIHGETNNVTRSINIDWYHNHSQNPHGHLQEPHNHNSRLNWINNRTASEYRLVVGTATCTASQGAYTGSVVGIDGTKDNTNIAVATSINQATTATNNETGTTNLTTQTIDIRPPSYGAYCWVRIL